MTEPDSSLVVVLAVTDRSDAAVDLATEASGPDHSGAGDTGDQPAGVAWVERDGVPKTDIMPSPPGTGGATGWALCPWVNEGDHHFDASA